MIMPTPKPGGCGSCLLTILLAVLAGAAAAVVFVHGVALLAAWLTA